MPSTRVRFAPSPTGAMHLGSALVALANAAFARATGGELLLRIDDTDRERSTSEAVDDIVDTLEWLDIAWMGAPRFQSTRDNAYERRLAKLLDAGAAYPCFCSEQRLAELAERQRMAGKPPRYDGLCRSLGVDEVSRRTNYGERSVVRLRVPDEAYDFHDEIRGDVAAPEGSFGDFVLRRSDGTFGYLFASACDDIDFEVSHVIRGEDHLSNTPRQLAILDALDDVPPAFAHLPLLLGPEGRKLAKRDPLGTIDELHAQGYLPATVRRYLAELLGCGAVDLLAGEAASIRFELSAVPSSSPRVSPERLESLGREDLAAMSRDELLGCLLTAGFKLPARALPLFDDLRDGHATIGSLVRELRGTLDAPQLPPDAAAALDPDTLERVVLLLARVADDDSLGGAETVVGQLREWAQASGRGLRLVLTTLRMALTGQQHGPPLALVLYAVGYEPAVARVRDARLRAAPTISQSNATGA